MNEKFEFKSAASGAIALDELQGIVECFVAGIGNKDSVGDIVVTGAFAKSLTRRKPRVVWAHSWNDPIGKVLEMYEVPAGDPRLPAKMRNAGIGGLYAKVQFNLQSEKGKEAFASVAFFGEEQEWSIGYKTINGAFDPAQQANVLREVELYEVSPVLHGANQLTGTISVKSEQKNHMMPVIAGMPMMNEQQQPRMIVIAAPEKEQDEPFNIFAEGLAQPLEADKVQKIQAELSERTGSKVDIVEATDSFIVFRRTTSDGKVSMYRVGYHSPDDYNTFMFGKPEAYSGSTDKPQMQQEIEVKPADESMVPAQPQQMPYRDNDQDEMNTMLGGQVGVGKSAYAHLIEIPQIHMMQAKSMLQPVFNYHNLSTTDSDNGIIVNGSISAQAIDALQTAVKAIGQTIGQSVGNLRTLAQSFNPFAIDGDNDGFAQDGTAFQRPYIPIKKPDMNLPEVGGKNRDSNELLDKPTIRTGKKPTKDPSLLSGAERQEALAAGDLQPRTMDDISFLANRRPENEGIAKYWDMPEEGLRAEGQKLVAARREQTGSAREATDGELFKISHEFARREAYKQQFGKDFVPPKRTESTGRETFDASKPDEVMQEIPMSAVLDAMKEWSKSRSTRGFGSRGDVTPEQQSRIDASRKRGSDVASGRGQILADNIANLSDEDKDYIRENGIVSYLLQDGTGGPLSGEWAGDSPAERIGDLLPEGDWSTDSKLQADAEDIFASYEEGFYAELDKDFAERANPADLDTPKAKRDRQRAAGQGEMFSEDDFDNLSADEQDAILEQGRDSARGFASRGEGSGLWGSNRSIDPDDDEISDEFIEDYLNDHVGDGEVEFEDLEKFNDKPEYFNRGREPLSDAELRDLFDRYQSDDDAIREIAIDEITTRFYRELLDDQYDNMVEQANSKPDYDDYEDYQRSRGGFYSRGDRLDVQGTNNELNKWWSSYDELTDSEKSDIEQAYFKRNPGSERPGSRAYNPEVAQEDFESNPEKYGYAKDFRAEAYSALMANGADRTQAQNVTEYWMENDALHDEYLKEADGDSLYAMALAYDNYIEAAADDYNERQRGFGSRSYRTNPNGTPSDGYVVMSDGQSEIRFALEDGDGIYDATRDGYRVVREVGGSRYPESTATYGGSGLGKDEQKEIIDTLKGSSDPFVQKLLGDFNKRGRLSDKQWATLKGKADREKKKNAAKKPSGFVDGRVNGGTIAPGGRPVASAGKDSIVSPTAEQIADADGLEKLINDARRDGQTLRFNYNGKDREVFPVQTFKNPKTGKVNMVGQDSEGVKKTFTIDKMSPSSNAGGFASRGGEMQEMRLYEDFTSREQEDLYESVENYLIGRGDWARVKNELEEGGFDYDDFLQQNPDFHPDFADFGDAGDMGFASRGDSPARDRTVRELRRIVNRTSRGSLEDWEENERVEKLSEAKAELNSALDEVEKALDLLNEDTPEWEELFYAQQDLDSNLSDVENMMEEMVSEKARLEDAMGEAATMVSDAEELRQYFRNIDIPSKEDLEEMSFEDANYEFISLSDDITEFVNEHDLSVDWNPEKRAEIEKALKDGDYDKANEIFYDATQEIFDAADSKYRMAEAEHDYYPFVSDADGFASRGGSRFDTVETPNSSAIEAVHYDRNTRELHVAFKPGQTGGEARYYTYSDVSPDYFDNEVAGSNSIGRVINDVKKNHDVEITDANTIDAINGREDAESDDMLNQVLQLRDEIGSLSESDLTDLADEAKRSLARDGFDGYELSDEYGEPNSLVEERMIEIFESRGSKPSSAGKNASKIQDIDVRRSGALSESYYDPNTEELVVTFKGKDGAPGGSYIYEGVTADEAKELASSSSKGKVINKLKASKPVRRASATDRMDRDPSAGEDVGSGSFEAQVDSHWGEIGPDEQRRYFARAVDSAINAGSGTSAEEITADAKARAFDDRQIAMMEMQAESLGMGYRNVDVGSSAALNRVQYDQDKRELRVEYRGRDGKGTGEFYVYENVPQSVVDDLEASDSRGSTLRRVRDDFDFRREEAIPESAFYSMGEPAERSNPKITNRTNENGFYLDENGKATNYNKRAYTTGDVQKMNARRNGRDGFASRGDDEPSFARASTPTMPDIEGMDEEEASDALEKSNEELLDFIYQTEKLARMSLGEDEYLKQFSGAVPYIEELSKNHDGGVQERSSALESAIDRAMLFEQMVGPLGDRSDGFASRASINESSTGQRIVPSRMHSDDREALAEITDPEERKQRIDRLIEFYGPRIFAKPSSPKRKKIVQTQDENGYWVGPDGKPADFDLEDGFASRGGTSKLSRDYPYSIDVEKPLEEENAIAGQLMRVNRYQNLDVPEYEPTPSAMPWKSLSPSQKERYGEAILRKNQEYFDRLRQNGASSEEIDYEIAQIHNEFAKGELISLERTLKMAKEDFYESARKRLEQANPSMSQNEIDDMLVDLGLSENDFDKLFAKNMDIFELAAVAADLESKRRDIVRISTPKTGGDRPKVDPLSILGGYSDGDVFGLTPRGFASRGASGSKKKTKEEVYAEMTKQLIDALSESEKLGKWQLPWRRMGMPENGTSGHKYSGSNWFFLTAMADIKGYNSNKWATYDQWQGIGGQVRKGEKATSIFVPIFLKGKEKADGTEEKGRISFISRSVFNLDQIDGMPADFDKKEILPESERVADLEKTISEIPAVIKNGGDEAYFSPSEDFIQLPLFENFKDARAYYSTAAHELMHWTGGKDRLGRENMNRFGTPEYAYEELVAEIASAMFMAAHNIEPNIQDNHGPYLASWIKKLKDDPTALERAMKDAQSAVNYVLDVSPNAKSKFSNGEKAVFENPDIAVPTEAVVAVEGFASRGDWPTPGGYEPGEFDMRTALSQIGRGNLMAISGTRANKRNNEMVLPVNRNQQVIVGYDGGSDTYFVRAEQIITNGKDKGKTRVLGQWDNVYADELGETAYQASLKPSMLSDENKTVWAQAFDHPQTGSLLDENGRVYENGFASGGDSMDPDELDAMDWAYDAAQDYLMEKEDMMPEEISPEDGFASRVNLSREEKNEIIAIARRMGNRFTTSVVGQYDRNGELSDKQWDALNRMTLRKQGNSYVRNTRGLASRGDKKPRTPKASWSPEDRQRYADGDKLRSTRRPGKRREGPSASEYGFSSRGEPIDMIASDIFIGDDGAGRSWGFEPIIRRAARKFDGQENMSDEQLAAELRVPLEVAKKMRKQGARTRDVYLLDNLRMQVGGDRDLWGVDNDPLSYYDESGNPILNEDDIPDTGDLAPDAPGARPPRLASRKEYLDARPVLDEIGISETASQYSIMKDNSDIFSEKTWRRILAQGITRDEANTLLKAKKSEMTADSIYGEKQPVKRVASRTDSLPLADVFSNQAFDSTRGRRGFPQQVVDAIFEITGRKPSISTVKKFINDPQSSGKAAGRAPFSLNPLELKQMLEKLGISSEEFDKFRSE